MTSDEIPIEKQIRIMGISMIPLLVAPFAVGFYFLHLRTMGAEVPLWVFVNYSILVFLVGSVVCMALNEALLRVSGGRFKFRRLVFRCTLLTSYFFLIWGGIFLLDAAFPLGGSIFPILLWHVDGHGDFRDRNREAQTPL